MPATALAMVMHNLYFLAVWLHWSPDAIMTLMLVAYCTYLINCAQFVYRGIQAGRQRRMMRGGSGQSGAVAH
jgi:2-vinyl bacteriochlorophyllide hydratase (BCHF).